MTYLANLQYTVTRRTLFTIDIYLFIAVLTTFYFLGLHPYVIFGTAVILAFRLLLEQRCVHRMEDALFIPRTQLMLT